MPVGPVQGVLRWSRAQTLPPGAHPLERPRQAGSRPHVDRELGMARGWPQQLRAGEAPACVHLSEQPAEGSSDGRARCLPL